MKKIEGYFWPLETRTVKVDLTGVDCGPFIDEFLNELIPTVTVEMEDDGAALFSPNDKSPRSRELNGKIVIFPDGLVYKNGETLWPDDNYGVPRSLYEIVDGYFKQRIGLGHWSDEKEVLENVASQLEAIAKHLRETYLPIARSEES